MNVAFISEIEPPARWLPLLEAALPSHRFRVWPDIGDPAAIEVALVGQPGAGALAKLPKLKLIQSLWMGVDGLLADSALPRNVPVARMVDAGMVAAMAETVLVNVLDWHRQLYRYRASQKAGEWKRYQQFMAADRTIGILGMGELGTATARVLLPLGFKVIGLARRSKSIPGVECFTDPKEVFKRSQALVCLLPLTEQTRGILNKDAFSLMPRHACLINVARGGHLVEKDLIATLDARHLAHAYLDVFEEEPLPANHPFWRHPGITLTPHVAALTEPRTAVPRIVENLQRLARGEPALNLVDRAAGY